MSPLNQQFWLDNFSKCPDKELRETVFSGLQQGVDIACHGLDQGGIYPNWPSVHEFYQDVNDSVYSNLSIGRVVGPWTSPPCPEFISSPLGAFKRAINGKVRTIHDLSFPPGGAVNDHIDPEQFSLEYVTVDEVARVCSQYDEPPFLAKSDLTNAFQHILVDPKYWHQLGFSWNGLYFAFACLPFGCRAAPRLFDNFARALEYMAIERGSSRHTWHYLDDTITCARSKIECQQSIDTFNQTARLAGFTLQDSKCTGATQVIEFLGIQIDTVQGTLSITQERLDEIVELLQSWQQRCICTKRELLSLIGKLSFASRVVRAGRTFLRRLINLSKSVRCLHFKVKLNRSARADLYWWLKCIQSHNGITYFPVEWPDDQCAVIFTDASDRAMGGWYNDKWFVYPYTGEMSHAIGLPIHYREMMAVCIAVCTFAGQLCNQKVILRVDNQAICHAINAGTIKCEPTMKLIRCLYFTMSQHNIQCVAKYISTEANVQADALSRIDMDRFRQTAQSADRVMTFPKVPEFLNCESC